MADTHSIVVKLQKGIIHDHRSTSSSTATVLSYSL